LHGGCSLFKSVLRYHDVGGIVEVRYCRSYFSASHT
jgi:hypothetical protein